MESINQSGNGAVNPEQQMTDESETLTETEEIIYYLRRQYILSLVRTTCMGVIMLVVLVSALILMPRLTQTFGAVNDMVSELHKAMQNLNASIETMQSSMSGFGDLDIKGMNEAIQELKSVIEPLSRLFNR